MSAIADGAPRCFAVIPAGGSGSRLGGPVPKQYLPVAGRPLIAHTIDAFVAVPAIARIVVVVATADAHVDAVAAAERWPDRVVLVRTGGLTRDASVANGVAALGNEARADDWVLVHDAARCGITGETIERLIAALAEDPVGGLLAVRLDDTVKRGVACADDGDSVVEATVDRNGLWRAQTPQMFRHRLLVDALATARAERSFVITDEASAVERAGHRVRLVPGSSRNFKVTGVDDLAMMDALLRARVRGDGIAHGVIDGSTDPELSTTP